MSDDTVTFPCGSCNASYTAVHRCVFILSISLVLYFWDNTMSWMFLDWFVPVYLLVSVLVLAGFGACLYFLEPGLQDAHKWSTKSLRHQPLAQTRQTHSRDDDSNALLWWEMCGCLCQIMHWCHLIRIHCLLTGFLSCMHSDYRAKRYNTLQKSIHYLQWLLFALNFVMADKLGSMGNWTRYAVQSVLFSGDKWDQFE